MSDCVDCEAGRSAFLPGKAECVLCSMGRYAKDAGHSSCTQCEEGRFGSRSGFTQCVDCAVGAAADVHGKTQCSRCPAGRVSHAAGASMCAHCESGRYVGVSGESECLSCSVGMYTDVDGARACQACGVGKKHPERWTTMRYLTVGSEQVLGQFEGASNQSFCGCDIGMRVDMTGECVLCTEGLDCKGMDEVVVLRGFASMDNGFSVFRCHHDVKRCPGGLPGVCARGRQGIACAECQANMAAAADGTCLDCNNSSVLPFMFVCIICIGTFFCLCLVHASFAFQTRTRRGHTAHLCVVSAGEAVTVLQFLGVMSLCYFDWADPLSTVMRLAERLLFDFAMVLDMVSLNCIAVVEPLTMFMGKMFGIVIVFLVLCFIHILHMLVRHRHNLCTRMYLLVLPAGTVFTCFLLSMVTTITSPLQCHSHPNGLYTLRAYPTVMCWNHGVHLSMIVVSVIALAMPFSFLCGCIFAVIQLPYRISRADIGFVNGAGFLFSRFRADCHWYTLVPLTRNALIAAVPAVPSAAGQVTFMSVLVLSSLLVTVRIFPWRIQRSNVLDIFVHMLMLMISSLAGFFIKKEDPLVAVWVSMLFLIFVFIVMIVLVSHGVYQRLRLRCGSKDFQFFLCHHKAGAGSFARVLQLQLVEHPSVTKRVFIDSDDLRNLDLLFEYVSRHSETFVILCSSEVLLRPYCAGEITTAYVQQVQTLRVVLPDFPHASNDFIDCYDKYVPTYGCLIEHGITLMMVQRALRWMCEQPQVTFFEAVRQQSLLDLAQEICDSVAQMTGNKSSVMRYSNSAGDCETAIPILADMSNSEALCAAHILQKVLMPHFIHDMMLMPRVLEASNILSLSATSLVLMCSNGCFHHPQFIRLLLEAADLRTSWVPVLQDEGFRFPSKEFLDGLLTSGQQLLEAAGRSDSPDILAFVIERCFKEIAVVFEPQKYSSTMRMLKVKGTEVALRLQGDGQGAKKKLSRFPSDFVTGTQNSNESLRSARAEILQADVPCIDLGRSSSSSCISEEVQDEVGSCSLDPLHASSCAAGFQVDVGGVEAERPLHGDENALHAARVQIAQALSEIDMLRRLLGAMDDSVTVGRRGKVSF